MTTTAQADVSAEELQELLRELDACEEAREWCRGRTLGEAWRACDRGSWMLWMARHFNVEFGAAIGAFEAPYAGAFSSVIRDHISAETIIDAARRRLPRINGHAEIGARR